MVGVVFHSTITNESNVNRTDGIKCRQKWDAYIIYNKWVYTLVWYEFSSLTYIPNDATGPDGVVYALPALVVWILSWA